MTPAGRVVGLTAIGATTALLWLLPVAMAEPLPGATADGAVAVARRLSPALAAAVLDADSATYSVGSAGALADPTLVLEAWDVNRQGVGQRRFGIEQEIKLWGKYGLERDVAKAEADAARYQSRATDAELAARVIAAHGEYNAAHEAVGVALEIKRRFDEILGLLRSRYGATAVERQDVIKAEVEAATAEGDVARRQGELKSAAARLNALIGRQSIAPLAAPSGFRSVRTSITLAGIQARARSANPVLAATAAQVNSAKRSKSLADLNYYPNATLGAKYVQRPGAEDTGEFTVGFKLPLHYEAKDAEQRAAGARLDAAQARSEALRLRIDGEVADAWFGFVALQKAIQIYANRQLPAARASVDTARDGFQAGTTDLFFVLEAERRLRTVQLDLLKLKVDQQTKYAELERLAGGSL